MLGVVIRVVYCATTHAPGPHGDPWFYHQTAKALADGRGYVGSLTYFWPGATAEHPPLYSMVIAVITLLGGTEMATQRLIESALSGAALIPLMGVLGRQVVGPRAGVIAAALAAVSPILIAAESSADSEALYGVLVVLILLWTYRFSARPTPRNGALLGLWIGLAVLARSEAVLFLAIPVGLAIRPRRPQTRRAVAVAVAISALVVSPWLARNWAELGRPTLSTNLGTLMAGSHCRQAYYGPRTGAFIVNCIFNPTGHNELQRSDSLTRRGFDYARAHASRLPYVAGIRFLNVWGLRDVSNGLNIYAAPVRMRRLEPFGYYPLLLLAGAGVIILRRRRRLLWPLLVPFGVTTFIAITSWGGVRFRHASELALAVLAAVALDALPAAFAGARDARAGVTRSPAARRSSPTS